MNSNEKIRQYVKKVIKTTQDWEFWMYIKQFKFLKRYINGVDESEKSWYESGYNILLENLGKNKNTSPEYICGIFVNAFQNELELNKHNVFETFKIIYALKILVGPNSFFTCYAYKKNEANIRFVEELLKKADFEDDASLYKVASMVSSIVLK